jgi:hypothetical protein
MDRSSMTGAVILCTRGNSTVAASCSFGDFCDFQLGYLYEETNQIAHMSGVWSHSPVQEKVKEDIALCPPFFFFFFTSK